jgi:hypothetical protein
LIEVEGLVCEGESTRGGHRSRVVVEHVVALAAHRGRGIAAGGAFRRRWQWASDALEAFLTDRGGDAKIEVVVT